MRLRRFLLLVPMVVLLSSCAPTPEATPSPSASPTASETPSASPTATPTSAPTPEQNAEFTVTALINLCTEQTKSLANGATYFADMATTEWLDQPSLWFVVIPKTLDGQDSVAVCGIGGTPAAPVFELEGESLPGGVADIRNELLAGTPGEGS